MADVENVTGAGTPSDAQPAPDPSPTLDNILKLPPFQYPPLPTPTSIRLVTLLPSPDRNIIRCTMSTLDLDRSDEDNNTDEDDKLVNWLNRKTLGPYAALSYTWGSPVTIHEEPIEPLVTAPPGSDHRTVSDYYTRNPFVYAIDAPEGATIFNTDFAMKYYVSTHPFLPKESTEPGTTTTTTTTSSATITHEAEEKPIEVDGCLVRVQSNLYDFLRYFHYLKFSSDFASPPAPSPSPPPPADDDGDGDDDVNDSHDTNTDERLREAIMAPLWIDALCINQADLAERAAQVQLMDKVYREAARVFSWLGRPDGLTRDAVEALENIYESGGSHWQEEGSSKVTLSSFPELDLVHWFALFAFFQRSWFRRAWVVQEAVFGRNKVTILYGGQLMPWEWLSMMAQTLKKSGLGLEMTKLGRNLLAGGPLSDSTRQIQKLVGFDNDDTEAVKRDLKETYTYEGQDGYTFMTSIEAQLWRLRQEGERIFSQFPPLLRVLSLFRGTDATDPRDKVFAFLNLAADKTELGLVPDYNATVQQVFRAVTETIIRHTKSLSILSQVQEPCDTLVEGLPGWVPDFSAHPRCAPLDNGEDDVPFKACGSATEAWFEVQDDGTIEVESINTDIISTCMPYQHDIEDMVFQVLKLVIRISHDYPISDFVEIDSDEEDDEIGPYFENEDEILAHLDDYDEAEWTDEEEAEDGEIEDAEEEPKMMYHMDDYQEYDDEAHEEDQDAGSDDAEMTEGPSDDPIGEDMGNNPGSQLVDYQTNQDESSSSDHTMAYDGLDNPDQPQLAEPGKEPPSSPEPPSSETDQKPPRKRYTINSVTRIEALWRCLVGNNQPSLSLGLHLEAEKRVKYPAPTSLGDGFSNWVLAHLLEMWYMLQDWDAAASSDDGDDDGKEDKKDGENKEGATITTPQGGPSEEAKKEGTKENKKSTEEAPQPIHQTSSPSSSPSPPDSDPSRREEQQQQASEVPTSEATPTPAPPLPKETTKSPSAFKSLARLAGKRFFTTAAIYAALYRRTHVPFTPSTVEFPLPAADLTGLAAAERRILAALQGDDRGDVLPGASEIMFEQHAAGQFLLPNPAAPAYLPSAVRLVGALERRPPARDMLKARTAESPQDALDGQWWEMALSQFDGRQQGEINAFEKRMRNVMSGRKLFTTVGGLLGVGPRSIFSEEDLVYEVHIIKGAKVPYVLARPRRDGTEEEEEEKESKQIRYRLIGEAYVHGIMNGEIPDRIGLDKEWARYEKIRVV